MKVTIVTVCFNAENTIEETIRSVLEQTYDDVEYLIKDGNSTDRTKDIVKKYSNHPKVMFVSKEDSGLYNAMNQALDIAKGDYVLFMNSGDIFYDNNVIEDMVPYLNAPIVYGNVVRIFKEKRVKECYKGKNHVMKLLLMGRMMSHQSMFTKTEIMQKIRFDESFKICADYNFVVKSKKNGYRMQYVNRTVSIVDNVEGVSSQKCNINQMRAEDDRSLRENFPFWYWVLKPLKFVARKIM